MTHLHAIPLIKLFHYLVGTALVADVYALVLLFILKMLRMNEQPVRRPLRMRDEIYFNRMAPYTQVVSKAGTR